MWLRKLLRLNRLNICKTCGVVFEPRVIEYPGDPHNFNNYCQEHVKPIIEKKLLLKWAENNIEQVKELKAKIEKDINEKCSSQVSQYQGLYQQGAQAAADQRNALSSVGLSGIK